MNTPQCAQCRYGYRSNYQEGNLQCRRNPPVAMVQWQHEQDAQIEALRLGPKTASGHIYFSTTTTWPVVGEEDWCGEFFPRREGEPQADDSTKTP